MSVLSAILNVFDEVSEWIVTAFQNMTPIFYNAETGLSFMGVLAVAGLSISVISSHYRYRSAFPQIWSVIQFKRGVERFISPPLKL